MSRGLENTSVDLTLNVTNCPATAVMGRLRPRITVHSEELMLGGRASTVTVCGVEGEISVPWKKVLRVYGLVAFVACLNVATMVTTPSSSCEYLTTTASSPGLKTLSSFNSY
jgi:hypothetical protein